MEEKETNKGGMKEGMRILKLIIEINDVPLEISPAAHDNHDNVILNSGAKQHIDQRL